MLNVRCWTFSFLRMKFHTKFYLKAPKGNRRYPSWNRSDLRHHSERRHPGREYQLYGRRKVKIAKRLDDLGVHYIEGGWPGSNPRDMRFFKLARRISFKTARLTAFGATRRPGVPTADDDNVKALLDSDTPAVTIFGKSWDLHVKKIMDNTLEENLAMINDTVAYLKQTPRSDLRCRALF